MPELGPDPIKLKSHFSMLIECPQCGAKMILHVGLVGNPNNSFLACVGCQNSIVPLVPGPIVAGPFSLNN